jgi:hypothetical protein
MDVVSYILAKKYVDDALAGAGSLVGKSAYEVAVSNGFKGTEAEWLESLVGDSPYIGSNGTWWVGLNDTGVVASPDLAGYATEQFVKDELKNITDTTVRDIVDEVMNEYAKKSDVEDMINSEDRILTEQEIKDICTK